MTIKSRCPRAVLASGLLVCVLQVAGASEPIVAGATCRGMCDASAGVPVGKDYFLAANDEDNVLRLYRAEEGEQPVQSFDMSDFIKPDRDKPESDFEAAARLGDLV